MCALSNTMEDKKVLIMCYLVIILNSHVKLHINGVNHFNCSSPPPPPPPHTHTHTLWQPSPVWSMWPYHNQWRSQGMAEFGSNHTNLNNTLLSANENNKGGTLHSHLYFHPRLRSRSWPINFLCLTPWPHQKSGLDPWLSSINHAHWSPGEPLTISKLPPIPTLTAWPVSKLGYSI